MIHQNEWGTFLEDLDRKTFFLSECRMAFLLVCVGFLLGFFLWLELEYGFLEIWWAGLT